MAKFIIIVLAVLGLVGIMFTKAPSLFQTAAFSVSGIGISWALVIVAVATVFMMAKIKIA